jgi:hypothetical protein
MNGLALAVLVLVSGGARSPLALPDWAGLDAFPGRPGLAGTLAAVPLEAGEPAGPPPCIGDVCQPRVSVPGFEPRIDPRGRRTGLLVSALERMDAGFLAVIARSVATAGLRVDYRPPQTEPTVPGRPNNGRLDVHLRWRLDAWHGPVWRPARAP